MNDDFFIGWAPPPAATRRGLLIGAVTIIAAGTGLAAALGARQGEPGKGTWNQADVREWRGELQRAPYPMIRMRGEDGAVQTAFLGTYGKTSVRLPADLAGPVVVRASLVARGERRLLATIDAPDWIRPDPAAAPLPPPVTEDRGEALIRGEILDAKCWFGAMRPGFGKTHKACAALCARGGLPLAFCRLGDCATGAEEAPLFLDADGRAHGRAILPIVADPVAAIGRLVQVDDLLQFRVAQSAVRRL